jgi:hypothetical protein
MFGFFKRKPKIASCDALADFVDAQAAFIAQKGIYEYSRARSGHYSKVLFRESEFLNAVEVARWSAFPLGLGMAAEVADSALRRTAPALDGVTAAVEAAALKVFDRYPVPAALGEQKWREAREALLVRLGYLKMHGPKRALDISGPYEQSYFDLMPIHEKLRKPDFPTLGNYLRVTLCNIYDELATRLDIPALSAESAQTEGRAPATASNG